MISVKRQDMLGEGGEDERRLRMREDDIWKLLRRLHSLGVTEYVA